MASKIRLGFVGANVKSHWAAQSHFPALKSHPDVEITAVCTTKTETAEAAKKQFGAKLAFTDPLAMARSPEVDAVAVVVRVPAHYGPTMAAIEAGKPVYTEWPLGRTTAEAVEMTEAARKKGLIAACGLQSRVSPALLYMKELIAEGYVGKLMACNVATMRDGPLQRPSSRSWQRDFSLGANALTIANGHSIDALRFVVGDFADVSALLSTQVKQWYEPDTGQTVDVTSPDNILVNGHLRSGAVASVHTGAVPWAGNGFRMEIYGTEGTLTATGNISSQRGEMLRVRGAQKSQDLKDLPLPDKYNFVPADFPKGDPYNVGQMYALFARAIREGKPPATLPLFDTAVELHRFTDTIKRSSDEKKMLAAG